MSDSEQTRRDWDSAELAHTVNSYLRMLESELAGLKFSKADYRRALRPFLRERSEAAIEFKFQNISAVMIKLGWIPISGYKPKFNYQQALAVEVVNQLKASPQLDSLTTEFLEKALPDMENNFVLSQTAIPELHQTELGAWLPREKGVTRDYVKIDATRKDLGLSGELSVLDHERRRLREIGKPDLADEVEHSSLAWGDGLGYDIRSFDQNGEEKFIEVKTTARSADWPFFLSKNELEASKYFGSSFNLYRLFNFGSKPEYYAINGDLSLSCSLSPELYSGIPVSTK